ncbi:hypothetical protein BDV95DRAFT_217562 [Massariosphaeria phaeospora]|uniref:Uncharacterized protein n=1 Tax=Massariosphaeria phaeospora TaxID=100035 RepID=A0A7C8IFT6_9PLEO|nr:hypothetical protein BDV95DRAFT_217562 [Massariosphaeria phaeospora]
MPRAGPYIIGEPRAGLADGGARGCATSLCVSRVVEIGLVWVRVFSFLFFSFLFFSEYSFSLARLRMFGLVCVESGLRKVLGRGCARSLSECRQNCWSRWGKSRGRRVVCLSLVASIGVCGGIGGALGRSSSGSVLWKTGEESGPRRACGRWSLVLKTLQSRAYCVSNHIARTRTCKAIRWVGHFVGAPIRGEDDGLWRTARCLHMLERPVFRLVYGSRATFCSLMLGLKGIAIDSGMGFVEPALPRGTQSDARGQRQRASRCVRSSP